MLVESQTKLGDVIFFNDCVGCRGRWPRGVITGTEDPPGHWFKVIVLKRLKLVLIADSCSVTHVRGIRGLS